MAYGDPGSSEACNNDIACFPEWDLESDTVALVLLSNGDELCSGSLLMTANQNFRPYFLSAFHCIDLSTDGNLSATEIADAEDWMFKFQYKMTSCWGSMTTTGITYNGADFRAAWNTTDFALMELHDTPVGDERFSWLGWDRSGNTPTSGTGIHHPSGDVMKISFDDDVLTETFNGSTIGGISHWFVNIDNGTLENGSSGSPLFNENKRVIGQLHSGYPGCSSYKQFWYGCFHRSWTGRGTNTTRLSNWLDPTGSGVMTTNTSRTPFISGPSQICDQATYTLNNLPSGATVNWIGSKALSIVSGQGTSNIVCQKTMFAVTGSTLILRAVITLATGQVMELTKDIFVGTPEPAILLCPAENYPPLGVHVEFGYTFDDYWLYAHGTNLSNNDADYIWRLYSSDPNQITLQGTGRQIEFSEDTPGDYPVSLQYYTDCGWSNETFRIIRVEDRLSFNIYPNPTTDLLTVELMSNDSKNNIFSRSSAIDIQPYTIKLWNEYLGHVRTFEVTESVNQISLQGLPNGMYIVLIVQDGKTLQRKIVWKN